MSLVGALQKQNGLRRLTPGPFSVHADGGIRTHDLLLSRRAALSTELHPHALRKLLVG
jgi:hypothetical protein